LNGGVCSSADNQKLVSARFVLQATLRCDTPAAVGRGGRPVRVREAIPDEAIDSKFRRRGVAPGTPQDRAAVVSNVAGRRQGGRVPSLISDYLPLVVFIALGALISGVLLVAPFLVAYKAPDAEKLSAYECGFNPFDDARMKFDVRFYLVSLLFIIFDLEVAFLFPWALAFHDIGAYGFWSMMLFLGVLTIGFVYEWNKGALEWD
jgi:NADH-quinone oxidoreductase subunit A